MEGVVPWACLSTCSTIYLNISKMKATCISSLVGCHTTASFSPQLPFVTSEGRTESVCVCVFLLSLECRFRPNSLRGAWSPQLRLQDPGRRPLRQHVCPVLLQPWIQPARQQHSDLPQWRQASVGQAPPLLCGWVGWLKAHKEIFIDLWNRQ